MATNGSTLNHFWQRVCSGLKNHGKGYWRSNALEPMALLVVLYFLAGVAGLQLQPLHTSGLTPLWPASGMAIALLIRYGLHLWPGIVLAMLGLAYYTGLPWPVGLLVGLTSAAEAALPLMLAYRLGFTQDLRQFHNTWLFLMMALIGPLLNAALGSYIMLSFSPLAPAWNELFLTWYLGNSIGFLVFGATLLLVYQGFDGHKLFYKAAEIIPVALLTILISLAAFSWINSIQSVLILDLLIPLVMISALRNGAAGGLVPVFMALVLMMGLSQQLITPYFKNDLINLLYLDVAQLWVIALTGLLVSGAQQERYRNQKRHWQAVHDPLTGLYNRYRFDEFSRQVDKLQRQRDQQLCFMFLDLDDFKPINDRHGHAIGDQVLTEVAEIIRQNTRASDLAIRWGGDEFLIILQDCHAEFSRRFGDKLLTLIQQNPVYHQHHEIPISVSIGIADLQPGKNLQTVLERADQAVYEAKKAGGNRLQTNFSELMSGPDGQQTG